MSNQDTYERTLASLYGVAPTGRPPRPSLTRPAALRAMPSWSAKARSTTSGSSPSGSTTAGSAGKTSSATTSKTTIPSTNAYRAFGNFPTVSWCTSPTSTRPRS